MDVYERMKELGIELPAPLPAGGLYKPALQVGDLVYVSGQGSFLKDSITYNGKVGAERTIEEGQAAARLCVLNALSAVQALIGDLNKIERIVKLLGFVASAPGFNSQPVVMNGASQLLADIFGEDNGVAARSAIGTNELPLDLTVEVEFLFKLKD